MAQPASSSKMRPIQGPKRLALFNLFALFLVDTNLHPTQLQAFAAPQSPTAAHSVATNLHPDTQMQEKSLVLGSADDKRADLTKLIHETLSINNKTMESAPSVGQIVKDEWTFDMVEYDLMDFLQDLSARYRLANGNKSLADHEAQLASQKGANLRADGHLDGRKKEAPGGHSSEQQQSANEDQLANNKHLELHQSEPVSKPSPAPAIGDTSGAPSSQSTVAILPVSLATGDHDIAESTWQYGIFDRFTRARGSSTASPSVSRTTSGQLESGGPLGDPMIRNYNTEECGLRTYDYESQLYPVAEDEQESASKELNQRRQRPPPGSSFFSSHKKFQASSGLADEELANSDERLISEPDREPPPLDSYGQSSAGTGPSSAHQDSLAGANQFEGLAGELAPDGASKRWPPLTADSLADAEFNLSSRRHWLQQQLGQTLQMLGFNSSAAGSLASGGRASAASIESFLNDTVQASSVNFRENMMKTSSKTSKSIREPLIESSLKQPSGQHLEAPPQIGGHQPLTTRQDELKLEARVIGGSDARLGDSPWSVSLQALVSRPGTGGVEYRHYCGGTIIAEYYILTAAHCLDFMVGRESRLFVVIGDLNWRMSAASLHGRRFGVDKLIIHSGYKSTAFGHDIGLIRTKESMRPVKVNGRYIINSVCLPEKGVEHSGEAELVGWGLFSNRNEMADSLQIADVPILPRPLCVDLYKRRTGLIQWLIGIELITDKQVCAGTFGRGICQGDSGSALVFNEKVSKSRHQQYSATIDGKAANRRSNLVRDQQQTQATIIGTVAFGGIRRCSYQSLPGVYMQTSKYMDWILPRIQS